MPYRFIKRFIARSKSLSDSELVLLKDNLALILESHAEAMGAELVRKVTDIMVTQYNNHRKNLLDCRLSSYDMMQYKDRSELHGQVFSLTYFYYLVSKGHKEFTLDRWVRCPFHGDGKRERVSYSNGKLRNNHGTEMQMPFIKRGCECHIEPLSYFHMPRL